MTTKPMLLALMIAGVGSARADVPAYCRAPGGASGYGSIEDVKSDDAARALRGLVQLQCFTPPGTDEDKPAFRRAVEDARRTWSERLGLSESDWLDAPAFVAADRSAADLRVDEREAWSALDGLDQRTAILARGGDRDYLADAIDERLTAVGRIGVIEACLTTELPTARAACEPDLVAFDAEKARAEVRADRSHAAWERMAVRVEIAELPPKIAARLADDRALRAKDPAYARLFDIAARTRAEWSAGRRADLRALALRMDDARVSGSRKAAAGCEAETWRAWQAAVSAIPANRFSVAYRESFVDLLEPAAAVIAGDSDGYLAGLALALCHRDHPSLIVQYARQALFFWPGYRGPRGAAQLAMMSANVQLDDRDARLAWAPVDRREWLAGSPSGGGITTGGGGFAAVSAVRGGHVEFSGTLSKETVCADYRAGTRLSRIDGSGRFVYEGTCNKYVSVVQPHSSPSPVDVDASTIPGLARGALAASLGGEILFALPRPGAQVPSLVLGVKVIAVPPKKVAK